MGLSGQGRGRTADLPLFRRSRRPGRTERRRGRGRAGRRRIELHEKAEKAWPSPLQALLVAERCAALSGCGTDFVMILTLAYTGMRWSEVIGLKPECVR